MVNQEILGGLKSAIEHGQTMLDAMTTMYNAGYEKIDIEDAAKAFQEEQIASPKPINPVDKKEMPKAEKKEKKSFKSLPKPVQVKPSKKVSSYGKEEKKEKVSDYGQPKKQSSKMMNIILIIAALLALGLGIVYLLFIR